MADSNRRHFPRHKAEDTLEVLLLPDDLEGRKGSYDLIPTKMVNQKRDCRTIIIPFYHSHQIQVRKTTK